MRAPILEAAPTGAGMNRESASGKSIVNLPDYAALRKLAEALWRQDASYHGAAVMVGAGFSRSAANTGDAARRIPLWFDLSDVLARDLRTSSNADPLRLAEEYCAYFGKQALNDLIKREINDAAWQPGELHKSLLQLPWSEVLTTNWDTLLERASLEVHSPVYNVVSKQEDLAAARTPRIVKLHGTVNISENLIFTQEDYRRYPQSQAAFVNFARQVFIENELCLVGFSGDDPNFLQWAGWVRDQLAMHARRIYLVGALNLTAAKRKYLESINVAPIDLNDLVAEYDCDAKHVAATKIFLEALLSLKPKLPWEWRVTQLTRSTITEDELDRTSTDAVHAAALLERQVPTLEGDRKAYPGWLVCPLKQRWDLQNQITDPFPTERNLSEMSADSRVRLLYEIAWRHQATYQAVPIWLAKEMLAVCDPNQPCVLDKKQQLEIALVLLKNARWFDDSESKAIAATTTSILQNGVKHWPGSADELFYHQAILARDRFDYSGIEGLVGRITDEGPIWKLRKASLLSELGRFDDGEQLIAEAHRELVAQRRKDRHSVHVLSRLAWAHWLLRGVEVPKIESSFEPFPSLYTEQKCSPWDHIEHVQNRVSSALEKQQKQLEVEPLFEPGSFRDNSQAIRFSNELHPLLLLEGIADSVGMPLRWDGVSFLVAPASRLAELDDVDAPHAFSLAIRAANSDSSDSIKRVFSRTRIACLAQSDADYLLEQCTLAVEYWAQRLLDGSQTVRNSAVDRLRVFMEVLARASVRANPDQARRMFRLASASGAKPEFRHPWLIESLRHLIEYALASVPEEQQHALLQDALSFPLQSEVGADDHWGWPNPVIKTPGPRVPGAVLDRRIDEIIDAVGQPCTRMSAQALIRLLPLLKSGFLVDAERLKIAQKLWGSTPNYDALPETGLLKYVLLEMPSADPSAVRGRVRRYLFEAADSIVFDPAFLLDFATAAAKAKELPSHEQAIGHFDKFVSWRPKRPVKDPFGLSGRGDAQLPDLIGDALAHSIVPALAPEALDEERFGRLVAFCNETGSTSAISAFIRFAAVDDRFSERVERLIRQGLRSRNSTKVQHSSFAILKWRDIGESPSTHRLTLILISVIGLARTVGMAGSIWTANQMLRKGYLADSEVDSLTEALPVIFGNSDYRDVSAWSREAVSASIVRASCVRLARDILNRSKEKDEELLRILNEASVDPLPEVRFARLIDS